MRIFRNPEALWREEDAPARDAERGLEAGLDVSNVGTSVILHHGAIHSLNILGTAVWKLCDGKSAEEIIAQLQTEFDAEPSRIRADVSAFLAELTELGLIHEE